MANLRLLIIALLLGICSINVQATGCYSTLGSVEDKTASLGNMTISVPPDMPVGSEIYRIRVASQGDVGDAGITCSAAESFYWGFDYADTSYPESSGLSPYGGRMYGTNLPGVSVVYLASKGFPYQYTPGVYSQLLMRDNPLAIEFVLIKTGDVQPGVVDGTSLPTALFSGGQSGDMHEFLKYRLSGQVMVTVPTCQIESPEKTVQMGSHVISRTFTGIGSTTAWQDASIRLINCPTFFGSRGRPAGLTTYGIAPVNANIWALSFQPVFGTLDDAQGIIKLDDSGVDDASGVGIQLATAENESSFINLTAELSGDFPQDGIASVTIPIFARYIQMENQVTPGRADSSIIYNLEYR